MSERRRDYASAEVRDRDRARAMLELYQSGLSHREIGRRFGITGQRVGQVLRSQPDYEPRENTVRLGGVR